MSCAGLGSKHRKDPSATPNIQHGLAFEQLRIVQDGGAIRARADLVLQHLLMDTCDDKSGYLKAFAWILNRTEVCVRVRIAGQVVNWNDEDQVIGRMSTAREGATTH